MEESDTSKLVFENVRCTDADIVGELNQGFIQIMVKLAQERLICSVANIAHAKQVLVETVQYAKERKAFGQQIGSFQHIKFQLAEAEARIDVWESYVDNLLAAHDDVLRTAVEAAKTKWWSSETQSDVVDICVQ